MPTSFKDLKIVNGQLANSYKEDEQLLSLIHGDNIAEECISEAIVYQMPLVFRHLFATIMVFYAPKKLTELWQKFKDFL